MSDAADELPWPKKGDRPFVPPLKSNTSSASTNALAHIFRPDWGYSYREGYYQAGVLIAQELASNDNLIRPFPGLELPMLFSFRHFLEISLKSLIVECSKLAGKDPPTRKSDRCGLPLHQRGGHACRFAGREESAIENEHGLMPLWTLAKRLMVETFPDFSKDATTLPSVEASLNDFHQVDSTSQTFRYHEDKAGRSTDTRLPDIDIPQLLKTMAALHSFFSGCESVAEEGLRWKAESEANARGNEWYGQDG